MTLDTSFIVCITMTLFVNVGKYDEPIIQKQRNRSKQFTQNSYSLHRSINVLINESRHFIAIQLLIVCVVMLQKTKTIKVKYKTMCPFMNVTMKDP